MRLVVSRTTRGGQRRSVVEAPVIPPESPRDSQNRANTIVLGLGDSTRSPAAGLLRLARSQAGISQAELARRAGVPASMVSAYERDRRQPTLATLMRLVNAAGYGSPR